MASVYGTRKLMAVKPLASAKFMYGFLTNAETATSSALGHVSGYAAAGGYIPGLTIGANSPKPARAARKRAAGYDSSWVDVTKQNDARAAGYKIIQRAKFRKAALTRLSVPVYITIATLAAEGGTEIGTDINYAWRMRKSLYDKITPGDRAGLGIKDAAGVDEIFVFGAREPSPPKVTFNAVGTNASFDYTTFCDPDKINALPTGWVPVDTNGYE